MKRWLRRLGLFVLGLVLVGSIALLVLYLVVEPKGAIPKTVAQDRSLPHQIIDGVTFHLEAFGAKDAPVIVVLHGGPGGDYRSLLPLKVLAQDGYRVVFYDQRGSGLSPRVPAKELTLRHSVEDLHRIVRWAGKGKPVALLGHSWGGIITAYYLARHPKMVAAAIMAEPGVLTSAELQAFARTMQPRLGLGTLWFLLKTLIAANKLKGPDAEAGKDYLIGQMMFAPGDNPLLAYWCHRKAPKVATKMWRAGATAMQAVMTDAKQPDGSLAMPSLAGAMRYKQEVLLIASSCNTLIGIKRQQAHRKLFAKATLAVIQDAGHMMHLDQPAQTRKVILQYLARRGWGKAASSPGAEKWKASGAEKPKPSGRGSPTSKPSR